MLAVVYDEIVVLAICLKVRNGYSFLNGMLWGKVKVSNLSISTGE